MGIIVEKFGGSCLKDDEALKNAAQIIRQTVEEGYDVVAVVSAQGDMTDRLITKARRLHKEPAKRELDVIMSAGEQLCASYLTVALAAAGIDCVSLLGWQAGVRTNRLFGSARVTDINPARIRRELSKKHVVVVAGFQGIADSMDMTTLGRGGSDTTAVALAAALEADICRIYSVIDGIYTADPMEFPQAVKLKEVSYSVMQELAYLGVKVLNPRAVELAHKYAVPIEVRSAFSDAPGTVIREEADMEKMLISGVTKKSDVARIRLNGIENRAGQAFSIFGLLARENIDVDMILQADSEDGNKADIVFTVDEAQADEAVNLLQKHYAGANTIVCDKNVAKVSVVGLGMQSHHGVIKAVFEALSEENINILMISSSELRLSLVVDAADAERAIGAIHRLVIGKTEA
ncbi:MAG: aspartate kinase [Clostridia bacterium]|nr:aspartate kinase [Clostridia bacterium]MBR0536902.1 aspartate kinase [Clostridia bacterium]